MEQNERIRCLIIGSGPAGYTAAIYASRANLSPVLYEGMQPGGQLTTTSDVENFPGYPEGISGFDMMEDLKKQAERFGANIRRGIATAVDFSQKPYRITIDGEKIIEICRYGSVGLRYLRWIFLPKKNSRGSRWRRYGLRRSRIPFPLSL